MEADGSGKKGGDSHEITGLLLAWNGGDDGAPEKVFLAVYDHLRRLARRHLRRENAGHTLQATALVHEAYLKLIDQREVNWQNRAHFFAIAAQAMRRILLDHARRNIAEKRGGEAWRKISLEDVASDAAPLVADEKMIALDEALTELIEIDRQQARVVELRYFGGLTIEETAEVLQISGRAVQREWTMARAWLYQNLSERNFV